MYKKWTETLVLYKNIDERCLCVDDDLIALLTVLKEEEEEEEEEEKEEEIVRNKINQMDYKIR